MMGWSLRCRYHLGLLHIYNSVHEDMCSLAIWDNESCTTGPVAYPGIFDRGVRIRQLYVRLTKIIRAAFIVNLLRLVPSLGLLPSLCWVICTLMTFNLTSTALLPTPSLPLGQWDRHWGPRRPESQRTVYGSTRQEPNLSGLALGSSFQSFKAGHRRHRCRLPHLFTLLSLMLELCCTRAGKT